MENVQLVFSASAKDAEESLGRQLVQIFYSLPYLWIGLVLLYNIIYFLYTFSKRLAFRQPQFDSSPSSPKIWSEFISEDDIRIFAVPKDTSDSESTRKRCFLLLVFAVGEMTAWLSRATIEFAQGSAEDIYFDTLMGLAWGYAFVTLVTQPAQRPTRVHLIFFIFAFGAATIQSIERLHNSRNLVDLWEFVYWDGFNMTVCFLSSCIVLSIPLQSIQGLYIPEHQGRCSSINRPVSPEDTNNLWGLITYSWMEAIMELAKKRPLKPSDVWSLSMNNRAQVLSKKWKEIQSATLLSKILRASSRDIAIDVFLKLLAVVASYARTYFIRLILESLTASTSFVDQPWTFREQAYIYALLGFLATVTRSLLEQQHFHHARRIGMRLRSELTVLIFEKCLKRKTTNGTKAGKIISMVSEDTNRVLRMGCDGHLLYGCPLEILLATLSLYSLMGWSAFVGLSISVISVPINYQLGRRASRIARGKSKARDDRQEETQELITEAQIIKLFGWTQHWIDRVQQKRHAELQWMIKENMNRALLTACWALINLLAPLLSFLVFVKLQNQDMSVAIAFTALSLFGMIRGPLNQIPEFSIKIIQTLVSIARIESFLLEPEVEPHATPDARTLVTTMGFSNGVFSWNKTNNDQEDEGWTLKTGTLIFKTGLTVVVGPTGSGKTALLKALLGDLDALKGKVYLPPSVSYSPQHPWLESMSIRDNIVFGYPFIEERYYGVIKACALIPDFKQLPDGDLTLVGERGVTLSGGQKARISLARSIYAPTKFVLLDESLSALDAHTSQHLIEHLFSTKLVQQRVCVLATHDYNLMSSVATYAIALRKGQVILKGPPKAIKRQSQLEVKDEQSEEDRVVESPEADEERWREGQVQFSIYSTYLSVGSWSLWAVTCFLMIIRPAIDFAEQYWLKLWGESDDATALNFFLTGYALIGAFSALVLLVSQAGTFFASYTSSKSIFSALLNHVMKTSFRWFDTTPSGRITNRFTNDIATVDEALASNLTGFLLQISNMISAIVVTSTILPAAFLPTIFFAVIYVQMFWRYLEVNREINRISSTSASPLFSMFQQVLHGLGTVRAFGREAIYRDDLCGVVDSTLATWYCTCTMDVWLSLRTQILGAFCFLGVCSIAIGSGVSPGLAGIAILSSMGIIAALDSLCNSYGRLVMGVNSLERITEYMDLPQEADGSIDPPAYWPSNRKDDISISVNDLHVSYGEGLSNVLEGLSFDIKAGERIAIAGRTGSGKSTLAKSLLRYANPIKGTIFVDGLDITTVKLDALRQRITLLPQDAVLFSGTLRENIDPFEMYSKEECLRAMQQCHLDTTSVDDFDLDTTVATGGTNFSAGQRQLISLTRALLRNSSIVIFDESTAAIDPDLDQIIQETIRDHFKVACVITIAHRLRTIIDYDRVMVLEAGRIVEFDTPKRLLENKKSAFYTLCRQSGDFEELKKATVTGPIPALGNSTCKQA